MLLGKIKVFLAVAVLTVLACTLLQSRLSKRLNRISRERLLTKHSGFLQQLDRISPDLLQQALVRLADANKVIYVALVDDAFVDVATNLYLTSFKRLAIANYLFVSMNAQCCEVLSSRGINCLHYITEYSSGQTASVYGNVIFNVKTNF